MSGEQNRNDISSGLMLSGLRGAIRKHLSGEILLQPDLLFEDLKYLEECAGPAAAEAFARPGVRAVESLRNNGRAREALLTLDAVLGEIESAPAVSDETEVLPSPLSSGEIPLTDLGNGQRFARDHGMDVRYCWAWGKWLLWDGSRWAQDAGNGVFALAKQTIRGLGGDASRELGDERRKGLLSFALKCESEMRLRSMVSLARSEPGIPVKPEDLDVDPWLLNVKNGTVHLRTGELKPHRRQDLITKLAPVQYDPHAPRPAWDTFLKRVTSGDKGLAAYLQRAAGYALTGDTSEQVLFLLHGSGANGKSTFLSALGHVLGDYARQMPAETLLLKRNNSIPSDLAALRGARFVAAQEVEDGRRLAESLVKQLTGGDKVAARFLFAEWFEFVPTCKIFLAANHRPRIMGTDLAIWRRVKLLPFTVTIPEDERDPHMPDRLKAEGPGILAWAVEGCLLWQAVGLGKSEAVSVATEQYRQEQDVLGGFIEDCCLVDPIGKAAARELYAAYVRWCETSGDKPLSQRAFGMKLRERGFVQTRTMNARLWEGLGLLTDDGKHDA
ncbi:MAG: phage/plasmid primase, P4 family [Bacillota bacterium]|nr:phage/plasmid primase, P4 family [Bacillota bacterium]